MRTYEPTQLCHLGWNVTTPLSYPTQTLSSRLEHDGLHVMRSGETCSSAHGGNYIGFLARTS
jgi:hypothetical protein